MKKYLILLLILLFRFNGTQAQLGDLLKQKAGDGVQQGAANATNKAADNTLNKLFSRKNKKNKGADSSATGNNSSANNNSVSGNGDASNNRTSAGGGNGPMPALKTYSKYDFVPGDKVVMYEDFMQDAIGDFPAKWNTNGSGEIMTVDNHDGHWLSVSKEGIYVPRSITSLPDNFTLEFDVIFIPLPTLKGPNTADYGFEIFEQPDKKNPFAYRVNEAAFSIDPYLRKFNMRNGFKEGGHPTIDNSTPVDHLDRQHLFTAHVAVWRQKTRVRVYINENKVCDAPSILEPDVKYNAVRFATPLNNDGSTWLMGNVKLAIGAPDTRNKLLTTGKWSTTGILFNVNSATIRPESYGALQQIAQVLKENADLKVLIVGHTDSDGNDAANMSLSRTRADAVKASLASTFGIDPDRMQTAGKGKSQPLAPNTTPEGKAGNRRVEFIKM